ncbi:putative ATP phosphoribosyltransferase His1 [Eremomyces bilateralis CBS 781.70]|uniref:ATP phosphoribosyltransferase n=1 Tax=Eremomyces bilateralis CBS 781.70 TaxID=1392243 RepID=A0A6G1GC31_9PEZI|nr:putative ATP phosphoribosyltransferase His1 [Eremomyces bilateralis CBS 781.70]KAF1815584.1 putative ATP phosphoribosyltransferase His1 [Eremomyces bilateralis CBS 781.70]
MDLVKDLEDRLLFAIPKKGRLSQPCLDLLRGSDIKFNKPQRLDITLVRNLPIALVFLPAGDIPRLVQRGRIDLGITGRDQIAEYQLRDPPRDDGKGIDEVLALPFGGCKLQVQVPKDGDITEPKQLVGKTVCTSFHHLTSSYFAKFEADATGAAANGDANGELKTEIEWAGGSVESSIALGDAVGIVDLVESGDTMRAHGLKAISTVLESTAVLIKSKRARNPELVNLIASRIRGVITAQAYVLCTYNIKRELLPIASKVTPGKRAPTINSLEEEGWVAVSSMVERKKIAEVMDELERIGAEDILVRTIENARSS